MAAIKGQPSRNVNGLGGRPREWDRDQIGRELLEWGMLDDSINLNGFCCTRNPPLDPSKITIWANECENFRKAYMAVKAFIAIRREKKLSDNTLHVKAYDLNASVYDYFLKQERRDQLAYEASLKSQEQESVDPITIDKMKGFFDTVSEAKTKAKKSK